MKLWVDSRVTEPRANNRANAGVVDYWNCRNFIIEDYGDYNDLKGDEGYQNSIIYASREYLS